MQPPGRAPAGGLFLSIPFANPNAFVIGGHVTSDGLMKSSIVKYRFGKLLAVIPCAASWHAFASGGEVRLTSSCLRQPYAAPFWSTCVTWSPTPVW